MAIGFRPLSINTVAISHRPDGSKVTFRLFLTNHNDFTWLGGFFITCYSENTNVILAALGPLESWELAYDQARLIIRQLTAQAERST
jgi:hypothetical protein